MCDPHHHMVLACINAMDLHLLFPHVAPHGPPLSAPNNAETHTLELFSIKPFQIGAAICQRGPYSDTSEYSAKLLKPLQTRPVYYIISL